MIELSEEDKDLLQHSTGTGFTKTQLAKWGLPWPAPKGWRKKLIKERGLRFVGNYAKSKEIMEMIKTKEICAPRKALKDVEATLAFPDAEYVSTISDAFGIIEKALQDPISYLEETSNNKD